ncbi:MAG TPA: LacI family DNA-binding transcriptional regulator [Chryseosolibacter sp.]
MGITIKQIAADLNLAISTVSKALGDSYEISPETKARVLDYATRMDYKPNPYASSLKRRRSGNIAVVLPEVSDSFFSSAIDGIEKIAQEKGYHVMVYLTHEDVSREASIIREFSNGRVDGVLMSVAAGAHQPTHLQEFTASDIPVVFFDRVYEEGQATSVVTNDFESGYAAAMHLVKKGCKRISFLSLEGNLGIISHRQKGFEQAMAESMMKPGDMAIIKLGNNRDQNIAKLTSIFNSSDRPDGVVGSVEKVAMQVYSVCHAIGLSIPADVKVIAFSHLDIASLLNPPLTTITQPAFDMGSTAATLLFKSLDKKTDIKKERIVLNSQLVERASTGK